MDIEHLKYPIGKFNQPDTITASNIAQWIDDIAAFPARITKETIALTNAQLDTYYRPDGWTIRQVIHHCADSHINSFIQLKLALTEEQPTIKPYFEERWAELLDSKNMPIAPSLQIIEGLHERWTVVLKNLTESDFERIFIHPEQGRKVRIDEYIGLYAWHCNHHLAHITTTKKNLSWR
jgi:hypothetical protein